MSEAQLLQENKLQREIQLTPLRVSYEAGGIEVDERRRQKGYMRQWTSWEGETKTSLLLSQLM